MTQEAVAQLPVEAVPATAHEFGEILDQQSSPDPVTALQHEVAETDAQASLPYPGELDVTVEAQASRLPDDAPTDWSSEQAQDYFEQRSNLPADVDPLAALDHGLREEEAQQTMLPDDEVFEGVAQQSLPTEQQLDEQQSLIEQAQAEEQGQHSLMTDAQLAEQEGSAAGTEAGGDSTSGQPQGADTTAPPDSPETTPDESQPTSNSHASGDAGPSEGGERTDESRSSEGDDPSVRESGERTDESRSSEGGDTSVPEGEVDPLAELDQELVQQLDAHAEQEAQADRDAQASTEGAASEAEAPASEAEASLNVDAQEPPAD